MLQISLIQPTSTQLFMDFGSQVFTAIFCVPRCSRAACEQQGSAMCIPRMCCVGAVVLIRGRRRDGNAEEGQQPDLVRCGGLGPAWRWGICPSLSRSFTPQ